MGAKLRSVAGIVVAIALGGEACAGEFTYAIPDGWRDLRKASEADASQVPAKMTSDAASGAFAVYAFDPSDTTARKPGATFNAVETGSAGRMTEAGIDGYCAELAVQMRGAGLKAVCTESSLISMNGVDVGTATFDTDSEQGGNRMLLQFLIPGRKTSTVLTYGAPKDEYARYLPVFRASARGTKGGAEQGGGGYSFGRGVKAALIGALVLGVPYVILGLARKRRDAARAAAASVDQDNAANAAPSSQATAAPAKKATKYTWMCPSCNNPVPSRLDQCRCGAAKPT